MDKIITIIHTAKQLFRQQLEQVEAKGGLSLEHYVRYLSMQFHLTKDVQRHFFAIASHSTLATKPKLREFLLVFGMEEEPHYRIALKDLENLGYEPLSVPLDVKLWWAYFDSIIASRPFVRLGATCILENLGSGGRDIVKRMLHNATFINERTSRFIYIHLHEELPHGEQVMNALNQIELSPEIMADLEEGAKTGAMLYLRMLDWVFKVDPVATALSNTTGSKQISSRHASSKYIGSGQERSHDSSPFLSV